MKTKARIILLGLVMAVVFCYVTSVRADSDSAIGAGGQAAVDLNFQIVIPSFIYFRVGTVGIADTIYFDPSGTDIATGGTTAGTGGEAVAGPGAVNVVLISNVSGDITIIPTNTGPLSDGGNTISFDEIETEDLGIISAPELDDTTGATTTITSAGVINLSDVWTYSYVNPLTPPAQGTYTGQITYTATLP